MHRILESLQSRDLLLDRSLGEASFAYLLIERVLDGSPPSVIFIRLILGCQRGRAHP